MTSPIDYATPLKHRPPKRFLIGASVLALVVGLAILLFRPVLGLLMMFAFSGTSRTVPPAEAIRSVGASLMHWGLLGAVPDRDPDYSDRMSSIVNRMTGINGFTESDGFHGDGTDWYEIELTPDLAVELRVALARAPAVRKGAPPPHASTAPPWWPKAWPADVQCYEKDLRHLVLPDSGTRAWFMRWRT